MDYAEGILDGEEFGVSEEEIIGYLSYVSELDNPFPGLKFSVLSRQQDYENREKRTLSRSDASEGGVFEAVVMAGWGRNEAETAYL